MPSIHLSRKVKRMTHVKLENGTMVEVSVRLRQRDPIPAESVDDNLDHNSVTHHDNKETT